MEEIKTKQSQAYYALQTAAKRMGENNYNLQEVAWKKTHKSLKRFRFSVTPEHKEIVDTIGKLMEETISPEDAMTLLWQYDTMKQRMT